MDAVAGSNLKIARRANAQARADFATWQMMVKLKSEATLSPDAQAVIADYNTLKSRGIEDAAATEQVIQALYRRYYVEMGGTGIAPDSDALQPRIASTSRLPSQKDGPRDNVTPFRPRPKSSGQGQGSSTASRFSGAFSDISKGPAWLIFAALVAVVALVKFLLG